MPQSERRISEGFWKLFPARSSVILRGNGDCQMKLWSALILLFAALPVFGQSQRIGVFDSPSIVVAYYGSPMWAEVLRSQKARLDEAKRANDTKKIQELEEWGSSQQDLAHKQFAGEAPITSILAALQPMFPDVARKAQVSIIVAELPYAETSIEKVDVTNLLLDALQANERTRNMIRELRNRRKPQ